MESVMRHFLRRQLGRRAKSGLPRSVLERALSRPLILRPGSSERLSTPRGKALAGTVEVTVVTSSADTDFLVAMRAAENALIFDHPHPSR